LQALVAGELFVEVAIGFFRFSKIAELFYGFLHSSTIDLAIHLSE